MDVLEYEKARIRMCRTMILEKGGCEACPLYNVLKRKCGFAASIIQNSDIDTIKNNVDRVIKWAKEHPVKTRQSEFLKRFPNADLTRLQPCMIEKDKRPMWCGKYADFGANGCCDECRYAYWNEEVDN